MRTFLKTTTYIDSWILLSFEKIEIKAAPDEEQYTIQAVFPSFWNCIVHASIHFRLGQLLIWRKRSCHIVACPIFFIWGQIDEIEYCMIGRSIMGLLKLIMGTSLVHFCMCIALHGIDPLTIDKEEIRLRTKTYNKEESSS